MGTFRSLAACRSGWQPGCTQVQPQAPPGPGHAPGARPRGRRRAGSCGALCPASLPVSATPPWLIPGVRGGESRGGWPGPVCQCTPRRADWLTMFLGSESTLRLVSHWHLAWQGATQAASGSASEWCLAPVLAAAELPRIRGGSPPASSLTIRRLGFQRRTLATSSQLPVGKLQASTKVESLHTSNTGIT